MVMAMREKLIELLDRGLDKIDRGCLPWAVEMLADHLIANGVTVNNGTRFFVSEPAIDINKLISEWENKPVVLHADRDESIIPIPQLEWIPVTERLPESKTKVLVYGGNDLIWVNGVNKPMPSIYTGYMRGLDEGWFTWDEQKYICNVTHWMPLPEAPKEVE